jgi:hypothetical protein
MIVVSGYLSFMLAVVSFFKNNGLQDKLGEHIIRSRFLPRAKKCHRGNMLFFTCKVAQGKLL